MENKFDKLRAKAETIIKKEAVDVSMLSQDEIKTIIHDLEVHQVELEMQNTELQRTQQNLIEARDKYFELFEFAPISFLSTDKELRIKDSNTTFSELIGFDKNEIPGKLITDFIFSNDQDKFHIAYRDLLKTKKKQAFELRLKNNNKGQLWVKTEFISRDNGQSFLISFNNISEEKEAGEALKESEVKLKALIKNFPNGSINLINKEYVFEMVGGTDYKKHNLNTSDFIGKSMGEVLNTPIYETAKKAVGKAFNGENSTYEIDFGGSVYKNIVCPIKTEDNSIDFALLISLNITDKVETEKELKESKDSAEENEALLQAAMENSQTGIAIADVPSGKLRFVNKAGLMIRDKDYDEIVKDIDINKYVSSWKILHFDGTPFTEDEVPLTRAAKFGETCSKEFLVRRDNNEDRYVWANAGPVFNKEGNQIAAIVVFLDITEQKKNEQALKESEERLRYALEGATDGVWDWNTQTNEIYFSPNWKSILGYKDDELKNTVSVWEELTHPEDVERAYTVFERYLKGDIDHFKNEIRMKHKKDYWVHILSRAVAVERDKNGNIIRVVGTHVDITEQKRIEEDLVYALYNSKKSQKEVSELLKAAKTILQTSDFEVAANEIFQACKRAIGAKAGYVALLAEDEMENELLFLDDGGLPCSVDPSLPMPVRGLRAEAYKTGKVVYDNNFMKSEWAKFMPKGHVYLKNVMFAPLNIQGKTVGVLGLSNKETGFTDNDAKLAGTFAEYAAIALLNSQTLENLEKRAKELQETNTMKDKLFSIIGHDLRNPLNNIVNVSDVMHKNYNDLPEDKREMTTQVLYKSAKSAASLLENLLEWSRAHQGKLSIQVKELYLNEILDNTVEVLAGNAQAKNIRLLNKLDPMIKVLADEKMTRTVMRNLISNAIKFTNAGGKVKISAKENDKATFVEIKDNGIGMGKEKVEKLFEIDATHSSKGTAGESGTGLGLIICKEFIEKNNGKIWVKSEPGKGSSFFISLPKAK